jgi:hypothetical protein
MRQSQPKSVRRTVSQSQFSHIMSVKLCPWYECTQYCTRGELCVFLGAAVSCTPMVYCCEWWMNLGNFASIFAPCLPSSLPHVHTCITALPHLSLFLSWNTWKPGNCVRMEQWLSCRLLSIREWLIVYVVIPFDQPSVENSSYHATTTCPRRGFPPIPNDDSRRTNANTLQNGSYPCVWDD